MQFGCIFGAPAQLKSLGWDCRWRVRRGHPLPDFEHDYDDYKVDAVYAEFKSSSLPRWDELREAIRLLRPRWVLVQAPLRVTASDGGRRLRSLLWTLSQLGLDADWNVVSDSQVGGRSTARRLWVTGYEPVRKNPNLAPLAGKAD